MTEMTNDKQEGRRQVTTTTTEEGVAVGGPYSGTHQVSTPSPYLPANHTDDAPTFPRA